MKARLSGGADFNGPIALDFNTWQVVDANGERWTVLDLVASALNTDPQLADADEGTYVVPSDVYKFVCMDVSVRRTAS